MATRAPKPEKHPQPRQTRAATLICALIIAVFALACTTPAAERRDPQRSTAPPASANDKQRELFAFKLFRQAQVAMSKGEAAESVRLYREALKVYEALEDHTAQAAIHNDLGLILRSAGQTDKALAILGQAVVLGKLGDEPTVVAEALLNLGLVHYDRGENDAAQMRFSDALAQAEAADDKELQGLARNARGNAHRLADEHKAAIDDYRGAALIWSELDRDPFAAVANMNIGYCQVLIGETDKAAATFQTAIDLFGDKPSADRDALVPHLEALIRLLKTDPKAAHKKILKSLGRS